MIIDTLDELQEACRLMRGAKQLGVDTETNGLHAYKPRVCIIQVSDGEREWLIDTLAFHPAGAAAAQETPLSSPAAHELDPLLDILSDPSILKILHGASHDIASLKEDYGRGIHNLFDTYIAAQLLDYPKTGLSSLVEKHFGVLLSKKLQKADWAIRPLSDVACEYLRHDVSFLLRLCEKIRAELDVAGLAEEAELESRRLEATAATQPTFDGDGYWRMSGVDELSDEGVAFLQKLYRIRDHISSIENRPPFKMIPDSLLTLMAASRTRAELTRIEFLRRKFMKTYLPEIIEAFEETRNARRPVRVRKHNHRTHRREAPDRNVRDQLEEALKAWRKEEAARRKISTMAVLPNHVMEALVFSPPRTLSDFETIPWIGRNRIAKYGDHIIALLQAAREKKAATAT